MMTACDAAVGVKGISIILIVTPSVQRREESSTRWRVPEEVPDVSVLPVEDRVDAHEGRHVGAARAEHLLLLAVRVALKTRTRPASRHNEIRKL